MLSNTLASLRDSAVSKKVVPIDAKATVKREQANNKRNNVRTKEGFTLAETARRIGIKYTTLYMRHYKSKKM